MTSLIVYSHQTGNTRKLAGAARPSLPGIKEMDPVEKTCRSQGRGLVPECNPNP